MNIGQLFAFGALAKADQQVLFTMTQRWPGFCFEIIFSVVQCSLRKMVSATLVSFDSLLADR